MAANPFKWNNRNVLQPACYYVLERLTGNRKCIWRTVLVFLVRNSFSFKPFVRVSSRSYAQMCVIDNSYMHWYGPFVKQNAISS